MSGVCLTVELLEAVYAELLDAVPECERDNCICLRYLGEVLATLKEGKREATFAELGIPKLSGDCKKCDQSKLDLR